MRILQFMKSYFYLLKYGYILGGVIVFIANMLSRLGAWCIAELIGVVSQDVADKMTLLFPGLFLIISIGLLEIVRTAILNTVTLNDKRYVPLIKGLMMKDLFSQLHKQSAGYFEKEMSGNLVSKADNVIRSFEWLYFRVFWDICYPGITLITIIISIMLVRLDMALMLALMIVLFFIAMYYASSKVSVLKKEQAKKFALLNGRIVDSVTNMQTVKSFAREKYEQLFLGKTLVWATKYEKFVFLKLWPMYLTQSCSRVILQIIFMILPLVYWYYDLITLVEYMFVQGLVITVMYQTNTIIHDIINVIGHLAVFQEALDTLFKPCLIDAKEKGKPLQFKAGSISFKNITFSYQDNKAVFKNFSLDVMPREKVGLIGYSGSGKSSLIKLILRYYDVQKGRVLIDKQDIKKVNLKSLHRLISYIPQEPDLLNRTIMENIRYAKPNASDEEVFTASKKAYCHDFILKLPNGYDSKVGERGLILSGGERQRIAIARAILKDAPILVLDEATSALDSESEMYIQQSLENLMRGKTVIAIAHRLSTLKKMTRIISLEKGKIIEDGTQKELMKNKKLYYQFYKMQSNIFKGE